MTGEIKITYEIKLDDGNIVQSRTAIEQVKPNDVPEIYRKLVELLEKEMRTI